MRKHTKELLFYVDDSGSRDLDRKPDPNDREPNWFALGGVIVEADAKPIVEAKLSVLRCKWPQLGDVPLRSYNIRNKTGGFRWLATAAPDVQNGFYSDLTQLIIESPIIVTACVIHRPGYNDRYLQQYGTRRWALCKTAFNIAVERASKYALHLDARLRIYVERCDKTTEARLKGYFDEMRQVGLPFDPSSSAKYQPLPVEQLKQALLEFRVKTKSSPLMQLADLLLWPTCQGGYKPDDRNYRILREHNKLLDAHCTDENGLLGVKYSCFPRI
jgi:hypothetical protein